MKISIGMSCYLRTRKGRRRKGRRRKRRRERKIGGRGRRRIAKVHEEDKGLIPNF